MRKSSANEIIGRKYGYLTVVGFDEQTRICTCKCECGNVVQFDYKQLKHKVKKSCGCKKNKHNDGNLKERSCKTCGKTFEGGPRALYCPKCRAERKRENDRKSKQRVSAGKAVKIGEKMTCELCGKEIIRNSARQRFCEDCAKINLKNIDRKQSLEYYNKNKDKINKKRSGSAFTK